MAVFDIFSLQEENINILKRRAGERNPPALLPFATDNRLTAVAYANGRNSKIITATERKLVIASLYAKQSFNSVDLNFQRSSLSGIPTSIIQDRNFGDLKLWILDSLNIIDLYDDLLRKNITNPIVENILSNLINTVLLGRFVKSSTSGLNTATRIIGQEFLFQGAV